MRRYSIPVLILLLTSVAACTENPVSDPADSSAAEIQLRIDASGDFLSDTELNEIADAYVSKLDVNAASKGRPSIEKATGSGHTFDERFDSNNFRTFAFVAIEKNDEQAMGQWELFSRAHGVRLHGTIDCLEVSGNQAWFEGPTTDSSLEGEIGRIRAFRVVDGDVDQVSLTPVPRVAGSHCANRPLMSSMMLDVKRGNVTVH